MKPLFAVAVMVLAGSAAHAGDSYKFDIGGRTVHIEAPSDCRSTDCVSVSIPGIYETAPKRGKRAGDDAARDPGRSDPVAKPAESAAKVAPPAPAETATVNPAPLPAPAPVAATPASQPAAEAPAQPEPAAKSPSTVVATAPVAAPVQQQQTAPAVRVANSPLGVWLTEKKEGKVRIEACGANLCGYSVNAKTDANGDKVLINMKPAPDSKWSGRIFDPNSGSTYDSTIALKGTDSLRVQGCAFGGMFCGGQTWKRVS